MNQLETFWARCGLKSLKLSRKPINTPLGVKVFKSCPLQSSERTLTSTFEIFTILVSKQKEELSDRRS